MRNVIVLQCLPWFSYMATAYTYVYTVSVAVRIHYCVVLCVHMRVPVCSALLGCPREMEGKRGAQSLRSDEKTLLKYTEDEMEMVSCCYRVPFRVVPAEECVFMFTQGDFLCVCTMMGSSGGGC